MTSTTMAPAGPPATKVSEAAPRSRGLSRPLLGILGLLTTAVVIQVLPMVGIVDERFLPPTTTILSTLGDYLATPTFWVSLAQTITTWAIGLAVVIVAGTGVGFLIGSSGLATRLSASTIEFLRPIPSVALIPLAILLYGNGRPATLVLVIYAGFWPMLLQVLYGVRDTDPIARDTAKTFQLGRLRILCSLTLPSALPYVVTGIRLTAAIALILTLTGELIIGTQGLGQRLSLAQQAGAVPQMYALVLVCGLLGVAVNVAARAFERRALRWHPSMRREVAR